MRSNTLTRVSNNPGAVHQHPAGFAYALQGFPRGNLNERPGPVLIGWFRMGSKKGG